MNISTETQMNPRQPNQDQYSLPDARYSSRAGAEYYLPRLVRTPTADLEKDVDIGNASTEVQRQGAKAKWISECTNLNSRNHDY